MRGQVEFDGQSIPFDFVESRSRVSLLVEGCRKLSAAEGPLGVDTETTGLSPVVNQVRLIQVASRDYVLLVDLDGFRRGSRAVDWSEPGLRELKALLESSKLKVLQNASFDLNFLFCEGVLLGGHLFDTMIAAKIYNNGTGAKNDLGMITSRELGLVLPKELQKVSWASDISPEMVEYAVRDALVLTRLVEPLKAKLVSAEVKHGVTLWNVFELEMRAVRPIARMQVNGFGFDITRARELHRSLQKEADLACNHFLDELDAAIRRRNPDDPECWLPRDPDGSFNVRTKDEGSIRAGTKRYKGFNPRSVQQMALRFKQAGILMPPGATGKDSLDQNILAFIRKEYPLVDSYMTFKTAATRVSACETLLKNYNEATGRIHGNYRQLGTETGRLSASEPNLQQIPRTADFRGCFVARDGYKLLVVDFSQIELRVAGELSGEQRMLDAYLAGRDLHTETAALMAGIDQSEVTKAQRQSAKVCFSGDTEVLTPSGWVSLRDYDGQQVAQYVLPAGVSLNPEIRKPGPGYVAGLPAGWDGNCGEIQFVDPLHYDSFYSDDVWQADDRNFDIVATGNHNILYIDAYGNAFKKALVDVKNPRTFVAAGYLRRADGLGRLRSRMLAMVVADGSFKQTSGWVSLGFSKRRKIHRCQLILDEAGINYKKAKYSNGSNEPTTFFKFRVDEAPWLLDYVDADKRLDLKMCLRDVDALGYLSEAQYWDGIALEGCKRDRVIVSTTVKEAADTMQVMAVTAGIPCTVHTEIHPATTLGIIYRVSYAFRTVPTWRPSWAPTKAPDQEVFCVQVPSSLILIRRNGKVCVQGNCNFGLLYGAGAATLRKQSVTQYGIDMSLDEARELVNNFRNAYPTLYEWQTQEGNMDLGMVLTKYGRRRFLVGHNDKYTTKINTQVQGTAGDITKIAMVLLWEKITKSPRGDAFLIACVHDELVMEVREHIAEQWLATLRECMEGAGGMLCRKLPIVAEGSMGVTWAEAK
jgi:DNA polymerase I-like protein with 3'-5' exonuclease and polymerase domains